MDSRSKLVNGGKIKLVESRKMWDVEKTCGPWIYVNYNLTFPYSLPFPNSMHLNEHVNASLKHIEIQKLGGSSLI